MRKRLAYSVERIGYSTNKNGLSAKRYPLNAKICSIVLVLCLCFPIFCFADSIVNSKHNLSSSGPGGVKAASESEVCVFCHAPHNATSAAPLWNRFDSGQVYLPYTSTTFKAQAGQPTGASKLCLSCHDGTVALGMVRSRSEVIPFTQTIGSEQNVGTDLSDDHPVSFSYDSSLVYSDAELNDPSTLTEQVRLDSNSQLQCTSCHDAHNNQYGNFLKLTTSRGSLCLACHNMKGWGESMHKNSNASWNGVSPNPWPHATGANVADNACENCHAPHKAGGKERLLNAATEEDNCAPCHNGNVAPQNVMAEFNKVSRHPIYNNAGTHDPAEEAILAYNRHVECADCHNSHAVSNISSGAVAGPLRKIKGVSSHRVAVNEIASEYELCFRCHADSNYAANTYVSRQYADVNTRSEFDPSNSSYHPIENIGKNPNVPSLIYPLTAYSIIKCTDCHNNNSGPGAGGSGPRGPHGSAYAPLLERNLTFADNQTESDSAYSLCYKCHSRTSILNNRSFTKHREHIVNRGAACVVCHDSHGVKNVAHLINFDRNVVSSNSRGQLSFTDTGVFKGTCNLRCHGFDHINRSY